MVKLFTAPGFAEGPRLRSKNRSRLSPGRRLPTPAELNGPPWARTPRAGLSPASSTTALGDQKESPEVFLRRPDSPTWGTSLDRIEHRDYSRVPGDAATGTQNEDYSDEPPSNRTSPYPGIRL